ncbi:hypothetical protein E2C01_097104 [Portunus trituberculatus]|uniref:Uncharacterized protein n=1 Tax=Portunus trituberculatus TaxID=210409 RepID=A0A5B7K3L8_PORTR|nr:hypothetical protein [Portunus trituberculatus]
MCNPIWSVKGKLGHIFLSSSVYSPSRQSICKCCGEGIPAAHLNKASGSEYSAQHTPQDGGCFLLMARLHFSLGKVMREDFQV